MPNKAKTKRPFAAFRAAALATTLLATAAPASAANFFDAFNIWPFSDSTPPPAPKKTSQLDYRPHLDAAMVEIERQLGNATPEKPLILLPMTSHANDVHYVFEQMLVQRVTEAARARNLRVGFGAEQDYDITYRSLVDDQGKASAVPPLEYLERADPEGLRAFRLHAAKFKSVEAPVAATNLLMGVIDLGIDLAFNDASSRDGQLNLADPLTLAAAKMVQPDIKPGRAIGSTSSAGVTIRNRVIAGNIMQRAKARRISVYIQHGGVAHGLGATPATSDAAGLKVAFADSTYALLTAAGANVMPIVFAANTIGVTIAIPPEAAKARQNGFTVNSLSNYSSLDVKDSLEKQAAFVRRVLTESGHPKSWYKDAIGIPYVTELNADIPRWLDQARLLQRADGQRRSAPSPKP